MKRDLGYKIPPLACGQNEAHVLEHHLEDRARREIEIGVINRNTMAERTLRYTEEWKFDPATKTWWVTSGLPDFWAGE